MQWLRGAVASADGQRPNDECSAIKNRPDEMSLS